MDERITGSQLRRHAVPGAKNFAWTAEFTERLQRSLDSLLDIDDLDRRKHLVALTCEKLGIQSGFAAPSKDRRMHLSAIAFACRNYRDPARAVTALTAAAEWFWPHDAALAMLHDCDDEINGLSVIGAVRLHEILILLQELDLNPSEVSIHELARRSSTPGGGNPLRGQEPLPDALRRLNGARQTPNGAIPLVLRVLSRLADVVGARRGDTRLVALVPKIAEELGYPADFAKLLEADDAGQATRTVLRIRLDDISDAQWPCYTIEGKVYAKAASGEDLIARSQVVNWSPENGAAVTEAELADAGSRFLAAAPHLTGTIGQAPSALVEFVLPWSILGFPVERWRMEGGGKWIGHQFPVVVRSLDRQYSTTFFQVWKERWDLLWQSNGRQLVRQPHFPS